MQTHDKPDGFDSDSWEISKRTNYYDYPDKNTVIYSQTNSVNHSSQTYTDEKLKNVIDHSIQRETVSAFSINPTSTIQFVLHMGYPPPPMVYESLRQYISNITDGPDDNLPIEKIDLIVDEIEKNTYRIVPVILFVIQQKLHSSKIYKVSLAIQLLKVLTDKCGLKFVQHINKEMMKSISLVIRTTNFKERTISGQLTKLGKFFSGSAANLGISTDMRVHRVRSEAKNLVHYWIETFSDDLQAISPIVQYYESLKSRNIAFSESSSPNNYLYTTTEIASPQFYDANQHKQQDSWDKTTKFDNINDNKNICSKTYDNEKLYSKPYVTQYGQYPDDTVMKSLFDNNQYINSFDSKQYDINGKKEYKSNIHQELNQNNSTNQVEQQIGLTQTEIEQIKSIIQLYDEAKSYEALKNMQTIIFTLEAVVKEVRDKLIDYINKNTITKIDHPFIEQLSLLTKFTQITTNLKKRAVPDKLDLLNDFI